MARQHWHSKVEELCPYLPGLPALTEYRILTDVTPGEHEHLLAHGWRRFGPQYFRPKCASCMECVSLRIPVATFQPTKSQRRARRKCAHLRIEIGAPQVTEERLELFRAWHAMREESRGWVPSVMDADSYITTFCHPHACAREMAYFDGSRLIAVGLVDATANAVSSIYFFYHPDARAWSPGVASVLFEIEWARQMGCAHVYLGYRVLGCPSTAYKAHYGPHELLTGRPELEDASVWVSG